MRIVTKRKINKAVDEIIDAVLDYIDFELEVNGYRDYDVYPHITKEDKPIIANLLYEILTDKKRMWWKLTNVAVRKTK